MRVLVTGAGGFLGQAVVDALLQRGATVRAMVRSQRPTRWPASVEIVQAELGSGADLSAALSGVDCVIHLAANMRGSARARLDSMLNGTRHLLEAMTAAGVRRLVLASSFSVYDFSRVGEVLNEQSPTLDHTTAGQYDSYAVGKVMQEDLVRWYAAKHDMALTVLRPGAIWGAGNAYLPDLGMKIGPLHMVVAPSRVLRLTYVENCADAFALAAMSDAAVGQTLNVVDDEPVTAGQYLRTLRSRAKWGGVMIPAPYNIVLLKGRAASWMHRVILGGRGPLPGILRPRHAEARFRRVRCENQKIKQVLSWSPRIGFAEAVERSFPSGG